MILEKIRQFYPQLTKSQRRLADFVATSYQEAAFMTASRLARRLAVNEATVIRFAQRLGYAGYPDLIQDIQAIVQEELKARYEEEPGLPDPFVDLLSNEVENLQRAISHVSPELAREAINALQEAERTTVLGQGLSAPLAQILAMSLQSLGMTASCPLCDPLALGVALQDVGEHDVVVAVSATTESVELANALKYAGQKGARTIALTWSPISACAQAADLALTSPANELFALPSFAVTATLIDALVQRLYALQDDASRERLSEAARARDFILNRRRR